MAQALDVSALRAQFPALTREVHGRPLVYLDNAATTQRPLAVMEASDRYYREFNANVHRGVHQLSVEASQAFEAARADMASWLNAASASEVVWTRGTTEAINLVANSYLRRRLKPGDEIVITHMEHHANIVPWQMLCAELGAELKVVPITDQGELQMDALEAMLSPRTRLVGMVQVSNALGTINPVEKVAALTQVAGVPLLIDGTQALPHQRVDVQALGCDFYCFSGHKMFGPTGIGGLWARAELLAEMPPWQGGGEMIERVSFEGNQYAEPPHRFEAGTPNIAGVIGLGEAVRWLSQLDFEALARHEQDLLDYATDQLSAIAGLRIIGQASEKVALVSFVIDGVHANDLGTLVDHYGVAVRTGHHCAMPAMAFFGVAATARASFAAYNTRGEIDVLVDAIDRARSVLA